jgi:hypothetical protein
VLIGTDTPNINLNVDANSHTSRDMTYFCFSLRHNGLGQLVSGSFLEVKNPTLEPVTPITAIGPDYRVEGRPGVTFDELVGSLPSSTTIVSWNGHNYFHRIGPAAARVYPGLVDLFALFVAHRGHFVSLAAFDCMDGVDPHSAAAVLALLERIQKTGRLTWKASAGTVSAFWAPKFYTPLKELVQRHPPRWVTTPETLKLQHDLL